MVNSNPFTSLEEEDIEVSNGTPLSDISKMAKKAYSKLSGKNQHERLGEQDVFLSGEVSFELESSLNSSNPANPQKISSWFDFIIYEWFSPLLKRGAINPLDMDDLYGIDYEETASLNHNRFSKTLNERKSKFPNNSENKNLLMTLHTLYGRYFYLAALLKIPHDLLLLLSPLLLHYLVEFVEDTNLKSSLGYFYVIVMLFATMSQTLLINHYFDRVFKSGVRITAGLRGMVYAKALRLNAVSRSNLDAGKIVNLMSNDLTKISSITTFGHLVWSAPLQVIISSIMLINYLGISALVGVLTILAFVPFNARVGSKMGAATGKFAASTDVRVKLLSEMLNSIRVLKMNVWESFFIKKLDSLRESELDALKDVSKLSVRIYSMFGLVPIVVSLTSFAMYTFLGNELTPVKAFSSLAYFNVLRFPLALLPKLIGDFYAARTSLNRIQEFLNTPEIPNYVRSERHKSNPVDILLKNVNFSWELGVDVPLVIKNASLQVERGSLVMVIGTVGSGKSSLLSGIVGDLNKVSGLVSVNGTTAYASQIPWLKNDSLKDNILFGLPYEEEKYNEIIHACSLEHDLNILPAGDSTEIGEKGINLSGGQKQRVSLARAVYAGTDIFLADDPLSAVDAHVGKHIFENIFSSKGMLKDKTRILVANQLHFLQYADWIIVMDDGLIKESGTWDQLMAYQNGLAAKLVAQYVVEDDEEADQEKDEETKVDRTALVTPTAGIVKSEDDDSPPGGELIENEERFTGFVQKLTYKYYLDAVGIKWLPILAGISLCSLIFKLSGDLFLAAWSTDSFHFKSGVYLIIYFVLGMIQVTITVFRIWSYYLAGLTASKNLHHTLISRLLACPTSFFDVTPAGRIINRFSKDMNGVDQALPSSFLSMVNTFTMVLSAIIIISISSPAFLLALFPLSIVYYRVQLYYRRSSNELKRLVSLSKSPVFSHLSETIGGLSTIRAYNATNRFLQSAYTTFDKSSMTELAIVFANRWLSIRLEFIGNIVTTLTALLAVISRNRYVANPLTVSPPDPGVVGLAMSYALIFTGWLSWAVRQTTEVESNFNSIERIRYYSELKTEAAAEISETRPPSSWPLEGKVEFKNAEMRYRKNLPLVLKGCSFSIGAGEKIGIVGRTGAGKSSIIVSMFRLVELSGGSILIDGLDISSLGLADYRKRISIIPQDPVLFRGTVRENLDPLGEAREDILYDILRKLGLHSRITSLDAEVTTGGDNFSIGQRQLICFGRALVKKTQILLLDEATASVDLETDSRIQELVRKEFATCTILTIAHRLNTVMDSDRILVMDDGKVGEIGQPALLLEDPNSLLFKLIEEHGKGGSEVLKNLANSKQENLFQ